MEKFVFKNYEIYADSYETRTSWGHTCEIVRDFERLASNKIRYYNRTWECYRYQSCILGAIDNLIEDRKAELVDDWKLKNNKSKATKEQKEIAVAGDALLAEYREMYDHFKNL